MSDQAAESTQPTDHLKEARGHLEVGSEFLDEGKGPHSDRRVAIAEVHANIALAEELRLIRRLLDPNGGGGYAQVEVSGHVTSGAP